MIVRAHAENRCDDRGRLGTENDRLRQEVALLQEEIRIKDARMNRIPAQRRPHHPPIERLAIVELRAARGWSGAETARRLLVTPLTVASGTGRLDEEGPESLIQIGEPVRRRLPSRHRRRFVDPTVDRDDSVPSKRHVLGHEL
jgi:hypothetical protein